MSLLSEIADSAVGECQAGGLWWKLEKPDNTALIAAGVAWVDLLPPTAKAEAAAAGKMTTDVLAKISASMTSASAVKAATIQRDTARSLVVASVVAVRRTQDDTHERVTFTLKRRDQDPAKGRLWVDSLDVGTQDILAAQAKALLLEGLSDRIAAFLGPA